MTLSLNRLSLMILNIEVKKIYFIIFQKNVILSIFNKKKNHFFQLFELLILWNLWNLDRFRFLEILLKQMKRVQ